jgi:hypothetical protein
MRDLRITIDRPQSYPQRKAGGQPHVSQQPMGTELDLPVYLNFSFIDMGSAQGDVVCRPVQFMDSHNNRLAAVRDVINAHPDWTDAQVLATAKEQGIRFGPDNKAIMLRLVPLHELGAFYGSLRIEKVVYNLYDGQKCAGCAFADLSWYIEAAETGTLRRLRMSVEPFEGKITSITESQ